VPVCIAAYLALRFPGRNEYKFLLSLVIAGAPLLGLCLRSLLERHLLMAATLLLLLLLPGARALGIRPGFEVTKPCRIDGRYLRARDPEDDALYQWMAAQTPPDAVFVAAELAIPSLGRRSLYVPVDEPWRGRDGWGLEPFKLRQWHVRWPDAAMARRHQLAQQLLGPRWSRPVANVLSEIQKDVPGRPVYAFSRDAKAIAKLDQTRGVIPRFRNTAGAVYELEAAPPNLARWGR
jgi:hypothetical protein